MMRRESSWFTSSAATSSSFEPIPRRVSATAFPGRETFTGSWDRFLKPLQNVFLLLHFPVVGDLNRVLGSSRCKRIRLR